MHMRARRLGSTSLQVHVCFQGCCLVWKRVFQGPYLHTTPAGAKSRTLFYGSNRGVKSRA